MGLNGTILVFPKAGIPPTAPDMLARGAIVAFERHGLLLPDSVDSCEPPTRLNGGIFTEERAAGELAPHEHSLYLLKEGRLTPRMQEIVYVGDIGFKVPIEVPNIEFSVLSKKLPIVDGYSGRTICTTWAVIAFSFGDSRYDEEIHRIRNDKHPVFSTLADWFGSPIGWDVQIG